MNSRLKFGACSSLRLPKDIAKMCCILICMVLLTKKPYKVSTAHSNFVLCKMPCVIPDSVISISTFLLYQIPPWQIWLYQFPVSCYSKFRYIWFRYRSFPFLLYQIPLYQIPEKMLHLIPLYQIPLYHDPPPRFMTAVVFCTVARPPVPLPSLLLSHFGITLSSAQQQRVYCCRCCTEM